MMVDRCTFFGGAAAVADAVPSCCWVIHAGSTAPAPQPIPLGDWLHRMLDPGSMAIVAGGGMATRAVTSSGRGGYLHLSG